MLRSKDFEGVFRGEKPGVLALFVGNLLPLLGVVFLGWDVFDLLKVYWLENVILGGVNVLKIISVSRQGEIRSGLATAGAIFVSVFFIIHYGGFCFVHGFFVFFVAATEGDLSAQPDLFDLWESFRDLFVGGGWIVIFLLATHLYAFFQDFLKSKEYVGMSAMTSMFSPYPRMIVLHVTIILGAFALQALGSPAWFAVILVGLKTGLDLVMYFVGKRNQAKKERIALESQEGRIF